MILKREYAEDGITPIVDKRVERHLAWCRHLAACVADVMARGQQAISSITINNLAELRRAILAFEEVAKSEPPFFTQSDVPHNRAMYFGPVVTLFIYGTNPEQTADLFKLEWIRRLGTVSNMILEMHQHSQNPNGFERLWDAVRDLAQALDEQYPRIQSIIKPDTNAMPKNKPAEVHREWLMALADQTREVLDAAQDAVDDFIESDDDIPVDELITLQAEVGLWIEHYNVQPDFVVDTLDPPHPIRRAFAEAEVPVLAVRGANLSKPWLHLVARISDTRNVSTTAEINLQKLAGEMKDLYQVLEDLDPDYLRQARHLGAWGKEVINQATNMHRLTDEFLAAVEGNERIDSVMYHALATAAAFMATHIRKRPPEPMPSARDQSNNAPLSDTRQAYIRHLRSYGVKLYVESDRRPVVSILGQHKELRKTVHPSIIGATNRQAMLDDGTRVWAVRNAVGDWAVSLEDEPGGNPTAYVFTEPVGTLEVRPMHELEERLQGAFVTDKTTCLRCQWTGPFTQVKVQVQQPHNLYTCPKCGCGSLNGMEVVMSLDDWVERLSPLASISIQKTGYNANLYRIQIDRRDDGRFHAATLGGYTEDQVVEICRLLEFTLTPKL